MNLMNLFRDFIQLDRMSDNYFEDGFLIEKLLARAKLLCKRAGELIENAEVAIDRHEINHRELKTNVDLMADNFLVGELKKTNINILSEETGFILNSTSNDGLIWIIDPLDGTHNFYNQLGKSYVSIALCKGDESLFGVVWDIESRICVWGGKNFGSYYGNEKIEVKKNIPIEDSILCTGIPARLNLSKASNVTKFVKKIQPFCKVRMFGSAVHSLVMVASGRADVYWEDSIMLWDVAAGIAIVEGAGGKAKIRKHGNYVLTVACTNCDLINEIEV
jgi:myo-inositol-1(or 4)-monophosphatase